MDRDKSHKSQIVICWLSILTTTFLGLWGCAEEAKPSPHPKGWTESSSENFHALKIVASGIESCAECHGSDYKGGDSEVSCYTCHEGGQSGHPALMEWINSSSLNYHGRIFWENDWDFSECQKCHGTNLNQGSGLIEGCQTSYCHTGSAGIYTCDNCHSYGTISVFLDVRNNSSSDSSTVGAHLSHINAIHNLGLAVDCGVCHTIPDSVFTPGHLDESNKINFSGIALNADTIPAYDPTNGTCANVYCHGTGNPVWTNSSGSDRQCTSCHGQPPLVGAHDKHVTDHGLGCSDCHSGYNPVLDSGAADSTHVNGTVNVNVSTDYGDNAAYSHSAETCSNVYCHGDFEPNWNLEDQAACGSCHNLPPTTGAHATHVTDQEYSCGTCHSYSATTHVDLTVDMAIDPQYGGVYDSQSQSCTNVACHGNTTISWTGEELDCGDCHALPPATGAHIIHVTDQENDCNICHSGFSAINETVSDADHINLMNDVALAAQIGGTYDSQSQSCSDVACHSNTTVSWIGAEMNCGDCHAVPPTSGAHIVHVTDQEYDCNICHTGYSAASETVTDSIHINLTNDVVIDTTYAGVYASGSCSAVYCHSNQSVSWTDNILCGDCHALPPTTGAHVVHAVDLSLDCSYCHDGYTINSTSMTDHVNLVADVTMATEIAGVYDGGSETCSGVGCHGIGTPAWNDSPDFSCISCHGGLDNSTGAPPYDLSGNSDSSSFSVGAHTVHLTDTTFTNPIDCNECHLVPTSVNSAGHFDTDLTAEITFGEMATDSGRVTPVWDSGSGSCSDIYCHGNFIFYESESSYQWAYDPDTTIIGSNLTLEWSSNTSVVCGDCHELAPTGHVVNTSCSSCHSAVVESDNVTIKDRSKHINRQKNVYGN